MVTRQLTATCVGAALMAITCGCGGSAGGHGGAGGTVEHEGFTLRAVDPTSLETTYLTPDSSANFDYVAFAGTAIELLAWRSPAVPAPEQAPIVYDRATSHSAAKKLYVINPDGTSTLGLTDDGSGASDRSPCWSPHGTKIAFHSDRDGNWEIYVMTLAGRSLRRLTNNPASDRWPAWSPDGGKIAFHSNRDGNYEIHVMNADGSSPVNLTNNAASDVEACWSPDGSKIAFVSNRDGNYEIYVMDADGTDPTNLTNHSKDDRWPAWSPDGSEIAFYRGSSGVGRMYIMNADGSNCRQATYPVFADFEGYPAWSPDGTKIVFSSDRHAVDVDDDLFVMDADGSNVTNITNTPDTHEWRPHWMVATGFRCLVGSPGQDRGYDPPLGEQRDAVVATFDEDWVRTAVGITAAASAVTVHRMDPAPSLPMADVYGDGILRVIEDAGRGQPPIRHIAIGNAETEGWIYRVLIAFNPDSGRVASMIAFRGELGPMAAGAPGPQCQVRDTGSEVVIRGSGMYLAIGDGRLEDTPATEIRLDVRTGEVLAAH